MKHWRKGLKRITAVALAVMMMIGTTVDTSALTVLAAAEAECTCGTDDPAFHATNCPAYISPENPQCFCAEKCTDDTLNVWCDVCGMQGVSACQGEDTAVVYTDVVASITNDETVTNYATFDEALANWTDGTTLTLLADVTLTERIKTYAKGLSLDLNGHKIECSDTLCTIWIDGDSGSELTIRDSQDSGHINGVVYAVAGGKLCLESGTVETVDAQGDFTMTGGQIISEDGSGLYVNGGVDAVISGGEIYGSKYGVYIMKGNVIISGDTKIKGAGQYAIRSNTSTEVVISGTPTISGGEVEFWLYEQITLNTQPADGKVWRVKINTEEITDGIFAVPGEDIALDASKFASAMDGYEVKQNAKGELLLCNHTEQTAVSNGDGTHNTTCNCGEATFDTNVACSGGVATDTHQAYCEYCNAPYGELNPDVHYDIIALTMTTEELEDALLELLNSGETDISILFAENVDKEMFTAINTALRSSTAAKGSVNLTIAGVQVVTNGALGNGHPDPELNTDPVALKTLNFPDAVTLELGALTLPNVQAVYLPKVTEWEIWGIDADNISTLVLTAPGTITADFVDFRTDDIDLTLHCNKINDVTDGTTWQGVTWKSISFEHSYTCTATSANVITKECANCGKSGTLTITAEDGVYDGTTAYGATVEKTGILENEDVTVNYYQGDTLIDTALVDAGTYTAKITYEDVTASCQFEIAKATPTADMFNYSAPANCVYDGTEKPANVVVKDGITGMGEITVKYYQNGTEVTPINAGTYTVKIDVAEGDNYDAATDIEVGTFEITKANTVITWNDQTLASTGEEAELTAPTLTFIGNDNPEVELTYSYKVQGDAEYTAGLPTACGIYDVKVNVSETDNYNAVEDTMTLTITCTDKNGDEYCDDCGAIYDGIGAHLAGYSVSLNGSIGVNFHMDLTQDVLDDNEAYMLFTLPNGTTQKVMVSDAKAKEPAVIEGKTYYIFTCNVAAKEMTDTIQAQLITSDGSQTQVYEYSVREYADRILSGSYDYETKELVKAMLHYGAYSQEWFDYNTTNLANAGLDPLDLSDANDWDGFDPIITNDVEVGSFTSAYLTLESDTAINLKFKLADGVSFEDLRVVVEDPMVNVLPVTTVTTENVCLITLTGIKASDLDTMYSFSVTDGEGNESAILYSAMSYACAVADSEMDQKLKDVTAALRIFNLKANEKFE